MSTTDIIFQDPPQLFGKEDFPDVYSNQYALIGLVKYNLNQSSHIFDRESDYKIIDLIISGQEYKLLRYSIDKCSDLVCDFTFETNKEPFCYFISAGENDFITLSKDDLKQINHKNPLSLISAYYTDFGIGMIYKKEDFNDQIQVSMKHLCIFYDNNSRKKLRDSNCEFEILLEDNDSFTEKRLNNTFTNPEKAKVYIKFEYYNGYCRLYKNCMHIKWTDGWIERFTEGKSICFDKNETSLVF